MNKNKVEELIERFGEEIDKPMIDKDGINIPQIHLPEPDITTQGIYWIIAFIEWLYGKGYEVKLQSKEPIKKIEINKK